MHKKCVIVGDGGVGKTFLLLSYVHNVIADVYRPNVSDQFYLDFDVDGKEITMDLWDTAGQEDYCRIRPLVYPGTDIVLICFSVDNPDSFENVLENWYPEIHHHCPDTPFILVGMKLDLRDDQRTLQDLRKENLKLVTYEEGVSMAKKIGAVTYLECSGYRRETMKPVFDQAFWTTMRPKPTKKRKCTAL